MVFMTSLFFLAGVAVAAEPPAELPAPTPLEVEKAMEEVEAAKTAKAAAKKTAKSARKAKRTADEKEAEAAKIALDEAEKDTAKAKDKLKAAKKKAAGAKKAMHIAQREAHAAAAAADKAERAKKRARRLAAPPPDYRWSDTLVVDWSGTAKAGDPLRLVYPAGTTLQVCVTHPAQTLMSVSAKGEVGMEPATVLTSSPVSVGTTGGGAVDVRKGVDGGSSGSSPEPVVGCKTYAPFKPSVVPVELKLTPNWTVQEKASAMLATQDAAKKDAAVKLAQQDVAAKAAVAKKAAEDVAAKAAAFKAAEEKAKVAKGEEIATAKAAVTAAKSALEEATKSADTAKSDEAQAILDEKEAVDKANAAAVEVVKTALEPTVLREETLALVIEPVNVGAVRVGVAAGWSFTGDGVYEAVVKPSPAEDAADDTAADADTTDTTQQAVITRTSGGRESVEFVVSYTHFFTPVTDSYTGCHQGVMLGLGIADLQTADLGLSSVYLGYDIGWRLLSVSPSVTMSRATTLAKGVKVGQAVDSTQTIPLKEVWTPGFAIVVHAPLDLMGASRAKSGS